MIYNRRSSSTGPVNYADDNLDEELYMGKEIKVREEGNESSSVFSHELVSKYNIGRWAVGCRGGGKVGGAKHI